MQVSRYIAPFSQHSLISAMLETSTDTLSRKSPRPSSGFEHAPEVLARQALLDELDAVLARPRRLPLSSAVTMVMRSGGDADVAQDQRQHALADAAEADEQDAARKLDVNLVAVAHDLRL